jgi:hypothetical protein
MAILLDALLQLMDLSTIFIVIGITLASRRHRRPTAVGLIVEDTMTLRLDAVAPAKNQLDVIILVELALVTLILVPQLSTTLATIPVGESIIQLRH